MPSSDYVPTIAVFITSATGVLILQIMEAESLGFGEQIVQRNDSSQILFWQHLNVSDPEAICVGSVRRLFPLLMDKMLVFILMKLLGWFQREQWKGEMWTLLSDVWYLISAIMSAQWTCLSLSIFCDVVKNFPVYCDE